MEGEARLRGL